MDISKLATNENLPKENKTSTENGALKLNKITKPILYYFLRDFPLFYSIKLENQTWVLSVTKYNLY